MVNDPEVIRWCYRNTYLRQLERRGIAIVPTRWISSGTTPNLQLLLEQATWTSALIKPAISADGYSTVKVDAFEPGSEPPRESWRH